MQGMVFDIQRYSLEDGPGIRTTVFLKGCPLRCAWCANPEAQLSEAEIGYFECRCLRCGRCVRTCVRNALRLVDDTLLIDRRRCNFCGRCVASCPGNALKIWGCFIPSEDVLQVVCRDMDYYAVSGGGMTISGGDVVAQPFFGAELLQQAAMLKIDTALETCALMPTSKFLSLARFANHIYIDLKIVDHSEHRRWTGQSNELILRNICASQAQKLPLTVRTPLIPGVNTSRKCLQQAADFLKTANIDTLELLPYHRLGMAKYAALGRKSPLPDLKAMSISEALDLAEMYREFGITAVVVGQEGG